MGTKQGPSIPCPSVSIPRPSTFHACLGQGRASRDPGSPKTQIIPVSAEGTQSHCHPQNEGLPLRLPLYPTISPSPPSSATWHGA